MKNIQTKLLSTMAISTIKFDNDGLLKQAKYCIVALGNLDPNTWTKSDVYAPVMLLLELCFITALAVKNRCTLKNGDVKQDFFQASLPLDKQYILRPPAGCPGTPSKMYWLLKQALYSLKRSPKHLFDRAATLLQQVGLIPCPNFPYQFHGTPIPGYPPLFLGLYVDDFVYFSTNDKVKKSFETKFGNLTQIYFMGQVTFFLGIKLS